MRESNIPVINFHTRPNTSQIYQDILKLNIREGMLQKVTKHIADLGSVGCQSLICPEQIQFARPLLEHPHPWQSPGARYQGLI